MREVAALSKLGGMSSGTASKVAAVITATGGGEPNEAQIANTLRVRMLKLMDVPMRGGGGGGGRDGPKALP
jgi:hypothetical protein